MKMNPMQEIVELIIEVSKRDTTDEDRGRGVKSERSHSEITCKELAAISGMSLEQIADIEHGRVGVPDNTFQALLIICACKRVIQHQMGS